MKKKTSKVNKKEEKKVKKKEDKEEEKKIENKQENKKDNIIDNFFSKIYMKIKSIDKYVDKFINILMPIIIILVPIVFILYLLNLHGYIPGVSPYDSVFRLDIFYRYTLYILVLIYAYKVIVNKMKITKSDIFLLIFMLFTFLSTLFAYNKQVALFGYYNRYEGLFTLFFYCFLYIDCRMISNKKLVDRYVKFILVMGLINFIVSLLQMTGLFGKVITMYTARQAIGLTENCNFLSSLVCLTSVLSLAGFILLKKDNIYYLISFIISYLTLLFANVTGPFLAFILTFIILIIYVVKKKLYNYKKMITVSLIIIVLYPVIMFKVLPNDSISYDIKKTFKIVTNLVLNKKEEKSYSVDDLGTGRIRIWKNVFNMSIKKPVFGYGPDNMGLLYGRYTNERRTADKAHNVYLNIFFSSGIFAMISYLIWNVYCIYLGFKKGKDITIVLAFGALAYSIQSIVNINVIEVTTFFYLVMGMMMLMVNENRING